jgi:hypothetical protein
MLHSIHFSFTSDLGVVKQVWDVCLLDYPVTATQISKYVAQTCNPHGSLKVWVN